MLKPYLAAAQVTDRLLREIAHIFWPGEWPKVLWSDEVTFLAGGRTMKQKVTRKSGKRSHPTCIEHYCHRCHAAPVDEWGAIRYGYKSASIFLHASGKMGASARKDYWAQTLKPHIQPILEAFALRTHQLRPVAEPLLWKTVTQLMTTYQQAVAVPKC